VGLDLRLLPLFLESPEHLGSLAHQLLPSDQGYLEFPVALLDLLGQLALEFLVFLVAPAHLFLLYFLSDRLAPDLLLQYFQLLLLLLLVLSPLYFHSVHPQDLLLLSGQLDLEGLLKVQLSLLDLLFLSGL
jgi:phosphoglycerol transferase MdoB-like AlkP superfamily enzyme